MTKENEVLLSANDLEDIATELREIALDMELIKLGTENTPSYQNIHEGALGTQYVYLYEYLNAIYDKLDKTSNTLGTIAGILENTNDLFELRGVVNSNHSSIRMKDLVRKTDQKN